MEYSIHSSYENDLKRVWRDLLKDAQCICQIVHQRNFEILSEIAQQTLLNNEHAYSQFLQYHQKVTLEAFRDKTKSLLIHRFKLVSQKVKDDVLSLIITAKELSQVAPDDGIFNLLIEKFSCAFVEILQSIRDVLGAQKDISNSENIVVIGAGINVMKVVQEIASRSQNRSLTPKIVTQQMNKASELITASNQLIYQDKNQKILEERIHAVKNSCLEIIREPDDVLVSNRFNTSLMNLIQTVTFLVQPQTEAKDCIAEIVETEHIDIEPDKKEEQDDLDQLIAEIKGQSVGPGTDELDKLLESVQQIELSKEAQNFYHNFKDASFNEGEVPEEDIVVQIPGWSIDTGVDGEWSYSQEDIKIDAFARNFNYYRKYFVDKPHINYVMKNIAELRGPVAVSINKFVEKDDKGEDAIRAHIRTVAGDQRIWLRITEKTDETRELKNGELFKALQVFLSPVFKLKSSQAKLAKSQEFVDKFSHFEDRQLISGYKFGALYVQKGQTTEEQIYSNEQGSEEFYKFLDLIGNRVVCQGLEQYRGGLDIKTGTTGKETYVNIVEGREIVFHVGPMLPYSRENSQQIHKKRHIGNDIVVIIFQEGDEPFDPSTFVSDFNHIFAVVRPVVKKNSKQYYNYKDGILPFGPIFPKQAVFKGNEKFATLFLTKLINAENSAYGHITFAAKFKRTRKELMNDIFAQLGFN